MRTANPYADQDWYPAAQAALQGLLDDDPDASRVALEKIPDEWMPIVLVAWVDTLLHYSGEEIAADSGKPLAFRDAKTGAAIEAPDVPTPILAAIALVEARLRMNEEAWLTILDAYGRDDQDWRNLVAAVLMVVSEGIRKAPA